MQVDYIIVGQGIAGSMLAYFLLERNKTVHVIDRSYPNSASNIAAGVVNPITGRRMAKSWMIDDILPFAKNTYRDLEQGLQTSFFFDQEIYKLFSSEDDVRIWNKKRNDPEHADYLGAITAFDEEGILAPFGAARILKSCWLDVPGFISRYRSFLLSHHFLRAEEMDMQQLNISDTVQYKDISAGRIIFCEGYKAYLNPYFQFVPFALAKGEYFTISAAELKTDKILNKNIYIIPKGNQTFNTGSTFIWDDLEETVTDVGRSEIEEKLKKMISCPYSIIAEKAGIRPAMKDRRPVIGMHPEHPCIGIFNGMGTKGVSLSPYFADHMAGHLTAGTPVLEEVSVDRFAF